MSEVHWRELYQEVMDTGLVTTTQRPDDLRHRPNSARGLTCGQAQVGFDGFGRLSQGR